MTIVVGKGGLEPPTPSVSAKNSDQLSYLPIKYNSNHIANWVIITSF